MDDHRHNPPQCAGCCDCDAPVGRADVLIWGVIGLLIGFFTGPIVLPVILRAVP